MPAYSWICQVATAALQDTTNAVHKQYTLQCIEMVFQQMIQASGWYDFAHDVVSGRNS